MRTRLVWLIVGLMSQGCQVLSPFELSERTRTAEKAWEQGQQAMRRGEPREAIALYRKSLQSDPGRDRTYLSLAAAHLECGEDSAACPALAFFAAAHPENFTIRAQLAELLLRLKRSSEARDEFESLTVAAQEHVEENTISLIHCQRRLMEIAETADDDYHEHLHRGIGLYFLARQRASLPNPEDQLPVEGLLCKAAAELTIAHRDRPEMARPSWYLFEVWSRLAQRQPALRSLREAEASATNLDLTPAERRGLELAWRQQFDERKRS